MKYLKNPLVLYLLAVLICGISVLAWVFTGREIFIGLAVLVFTAGLVSLLFEVMVWKIRDHFRKNVV